MSIKLYTLADWTPLQGSIVLAGKEARRIKIEFNCERETALAAKLDETPARFLTTVPAGVSTLEFWASGKVEIAPFEDDGAIVHWYSTEDDKMVFAGTGESFTTIHERAPRNEALEWAMFQSELNQRRMQADLRAEFEGQLSALKAQYDGKTGVHGGEVAEPQKPAKAAKKGEKAVSDPGGSGKPGLQQQQPAKPAPAGDGDNEPPEGEEQG